MQRIKEGLKIPLTDIQHGDLIYVEQGTLEICFENMSYSA